jgi:GTP-binding protein
MFTDNVTIKVVAGQGGNGKLSFRSRHGQAKGGPDGGDGGNGGNVVLRADNNNSTLSKFRSAKLWQADAGVNGGSNDRRGANAEDMVLTVLPGTSVYSEGVLIADLVHHGDEAVVAKGGRGGFGNAHFTSSTRQAPKIAEFGELGEEKELHLELKLVADVGLVGLPNAGKSTLLSVISNARPQIADYPFTTLTPNLGVVDMDNQTFLVADIPGLIEGAAEGKGLGDEFLRHIERTKVLIHMIDALEGDESIAYKTIQGELGSYRVDLTKLPQIIVLNKVDGLSEAEVKAKRSKLAKVAKVKVGDIFTISAVAKRGLDALLRHVLEVVASSKAQAKEESEVEVEVPMPVITLTDTSEFWKVEKDSDGVFEVTGASLEGFARRSNFTQWQSKERVLDILKRRGVLREIRRQGGVEGATIRIAGKTLQW